MKTYFKSVSWECVRDMLYLYNGAEMVDPGEADRHISIHRGIVMGHVRIGNKNKLFLTPAGRSLVNKLLSDADVLPKPLAALMTAQKHEGINPLSDPDTNRYLSHHKLAVPINTTTFEMTKNGRMLVNKVVKNYITLSYAVGSLV